MTDPTREASSPTDHGRPALPPAPIARLLDPLARFLHVEAAGGIVLLVCTAAALAVANSPLDSAYHHLWETELGISLGSHQLRLSLEHWINDGLMAVFFFVVGLEVKRELVVGELRDPRRAALPIFAALGGMVVPAGVYLLLAGAGPAAQGWGIPMATDIAFVVGCMALLGPRVPHGFRVMLLTLAIADDVGAILVIALGYATGVHAAALVLAAAGLAAVLVLQRLGVRSFGVYALLGVGIWLAVLRSGIHATIAGVLLGLVTPARPVVPAATSAALLADWRIAIDPGAWDEMEDRPARVGSIVTAARAAISPLEYLEDLLHPWVSFAIMPIFALANAGVAFDVRDVGHPAAVAVAAGLVVGKPVGVVAASWLAVRAGLARLPDGVRWPALAGAGMLAGIGFTMALFIAGLALPAELRAPAKLGILLASAVAAAAGMAVLGVVLPSREKR